MAVNTGIRCCILQHASINRDEGMNDIELGELKPAPDFELTDCEGRQVRLSDYKGARHVVLIFNRGFV